MYRRLIVNADDFGLSPGVNRAVLHAHERGIVTSASLMVRQPGAASAAASCTDYPTLSIGLHLDFGEWRYEADEWKPTYEVVRLDDPVAVETETRSQLEEFRRLVGRDPTHLDSHQHVHCREPLRGIALELALELGVPLRHFDSTISYCGDFFGQTAEGVPLPGAVDTDALIRILTCLPPGTTELACHPGEITDQQYGLTMYRTEREKEVATLCDPLVRAVCVAEDIELSSFTDVAQQRDR